jgi:hypothetical protein
VLSDEEYQYGAAAAGPAYFWKDDERCPWILILKSFWVRPGDRRNGIARAFAGFARDIGLPTYLGFANKNVEVWFHSEFRPTENLSKLQSKIAMAMRGRTGGSEPDRAADFTVHIQAEASALRLWNSWHGGSSERVGLEEALCSPDRMDLWAADSGEEFEAGFSDSAFADDRSFGYVLTPWCDGWGPDEGPFDSLSHEVSPDEWDAAERAYAQKSAFAAGSIDGWVTDPKAMCAYATVRHFLRNIDWREFHGVDEAADELFVRDLHDQPRGLRRFSALVSPISELP